MEQSKRSITETLRIAIEQQNARQVGLTVDHLRFRFYLNYLECFHLANSLTGISKEDWEQLLYQADTCH